MASPCWPWSALVTLILCITITKGTNNNLHHHMSIEDIRRTFHVESHTEVPDYEVVAVRALSKRSSGQENEEPSLVAHLEAFGKPLQLELQRTRTLSRSAPPSTLRMWAADPNHPHGVHLSEIPQAEHDVDIGHTYQDEINEAALLVHTNPQDGTLIVEGTIGKDLIVRPLPRSVKHLVDEQRGESNLTENEDEEEEDGDDDIDPNDDEMFLDQEPGQEVAVRTGFPLPPEKPAKKKASQIILDNTNNKPKSRSKRSAARVGMHVVIKRQTNEINPEDSLSDYGNKF